MCGIVGFAGHDISEKSLQCAIDVMHHRGPDGSGMFIDREAALGLGHARLSIIDLECGGQPLYSEDGDLVLVCNGEIYDFERIRTELEGKGHRFATHSDSEVIIHLYQEHGLDFMRHLRGEFAFLLYDKGRQELLAVRDRFGIKPLFFNEHNGKYLFASEAKAIFATGALQAQLDVSAIRNCLSMVTPDSIFKGVDVVFPGTLLRVNLKTGTRETVQYWDLDLAPDGVLAMDQKVEDTIAAVRKEVEEAIRLRLRSDVPVGVYLSGGIDSAIVAATVAKQFPGKLKVFTVSFPEIDLFNEYQLAKNLAEKIGAEFHSVKCGHAALLDNTEGSLWVNEMPFFNFHGVGKFMLSALAKEHVTVVLTGEGSDEVFLGYDVFRHVNKSADKPEAAIPNPGTFARNFFDALGFVPERGLQVLFSGTVQGVLRSLFHVQHRNNLRDKHPFELMQRRFNRKQLERLSKLRRAQYMWIKSMLPQYILTMLGDRSELAHSIEGRTPFLDHHLFERARRIPDSYKIHEGTEKYVLREAFKEDITEEIYMRRKWPYLAPPLWIRKGNHKKLDMLMDEYLSHEAVEQSGIFSLRTLHVMQSLSKLLFFDCRLKRGINAFLMFALSVQILDRFYVRDFDRMLEEKQQKG